MEVLRKYLIKNGEAGVETLAKEFGRNAKTIRRWSKQGIPSQHIAYRLAKVCGSTDEAALALAQECVSVEAKETA